MKEIVTEELKTTKLPSHSIHGVRQKTRILSDCKICGVTARYSYYGTIVCQSCKMFFKRNAEIRQTILECDYGGYCDIDVNNRRTCPSCRLTKCFANGMHIEMIRSSLTKKNNRIIRKRKPDLILSTSTVLAKLNGKQSELFPTSNLLQTDQSILTIDQWNLLSNLVHHFDEYSGFLLVDRFIHDQNTLPIKLRFKYSSVNEFFTSMMGKVQLIFEKNRDLLSLSSLDRTNLLLSTVKYTSSIGTIFILRQAQLFNYPSFYNSAELIFQPTATALIRRVIDQLDSDDTFIKIILTVLSFSTINYTVYTESAPINQTNVKFMLPHHDMYTELAWKYLLHKYGHDQAVKRFANLLRCLFIVNDAVAEAHQSQHFTEIIDSVVEQTQQTFDK